MTLRKKLMLSFLILVLLMGSMIGYFSYQNAKNLVLDNKEQEMADTINRIDISINSQVQQINRLAENVKSSQIVRAYLKKEIHTQEETEELNDWMEGLLNLISSCSDLILMNEDGTVYYSYSGCQEVNDKRRMEVYENAASNLVGDGTWTEKGSSLCQKNAEEVVTFVSSIDKIILAIELNPETFGLLMLNNYSTFQNQYTYLVDCAGNVLCSNKTNIYDWGDVVTKGMEKGVRRYEFNWDNKDYFACRQYNGLTGWETYSVVSTDDFFPQAKRLREAIMGLVLLAMLAAGVGIFILSYTFTRPIGRLKNAMKQVEAGDFEIQVESKAHDEIGMLIQSFNYMVSRLRQLIMEVYQQKLAQKNAELTALQAQINPHFLYNTLDSINWMLIEKGEWEISDVVVSLGDILKYSLHGEEMLVLFEEELKYIESYLCIQKNRLEDRLTVQIEIDEEAKLCFVPKLILQPIVENAILHGIEKKKEMGRIQIHAIVREGTLEIRVTDDGIGMQPDRLMRFRESIMSDEISGKHIGMRNVHRRIQLHFGEAYGLKIDSEWQKGTTVTILLPVQKMKIVIVDDEPKIRNGLSKLLSSRPGFEITGVFENAMEALEQLSVSYADVIITDIKMPEINGLDLINRIREKDENTKIIILSGYSDFSFAQRAIELGVTRYLTKPTNARELIGILEEIEKNIQKPRSEEKQEMKVTNLFVQKAMDYISMNYSQKLTLTKISEQLCITPNYLSELFKKHTGQNVSEYIIDYRLEKACQFLKNPQLRIGEVSEKVGINDVRYFSSMFKKKYNLTPTEYRNKQ